MNLNKNYSAEPLHVSFNQLLLLIFCLTFTFTVSGCGSDTTGTDTDPNGGGNNGGGGGVEIGSSPTFDNVGLLFLNNCGTCHTSQQESGVRLNTYTNVIESVGDRYGILVVQPGDADGSPLIDKIESDNPEEGEQMPQGGPFLSTERINQIKAWIDNGAENDESDD